jgi:hypothetical protein
MAITAPPRRRTTSECTVHIVTVNDAVIVTVSGGQQPSPKAPRWDCSFAVAASCRRTR